MKKDFYKQHLFRKFLKNECNEHELNLVFNYLKVNSSDEDLKELVEAELEKLTSTEIILDSEISDQIYNNISDCIENEHNSSIQKINSVATTKFHFYKIAAGFAIIIVSALLVFNIYLNKNQVIKSKYGQTVRVVLPDHSVVILNGNTTLTYNKSWNTNQPRQVWLDGEAYFTVKHTKNNQKFFVLTDNMNIEVLGTEFNVFTRRQKTKVVLNCGKVKVDVDMREKDRKTLYMKPGEMVEYEKAGEHLTRKLVDPVIYSSWKDKKLIFNNTSLEEIAALIEDTYGYKVIYNNKVDINRKLTGSIPNDDIHVLMNALSYYNIKIDKLDSTLTSK